MEVGACAVGCLAVANVPIQTDVRRGKLLFLRLYLGLSLRRLALSLVRWRVGLGHAGLGQQPGSDEGIPVRCKLSRSQETRPVTQIVGVL